MKFDKVVSSMHQLPLLRNTDPYYSFLLEVDSIQVHNVTGRNMSMKYPNDPSGNRTRELVSSSSVPQTNTPRRATFVI